MLSHLNRSGLRNGRLPMSRFNRCAHVAVLGAGPCGIAAAMTLMKKAEVDVTIVDKRSPREFDKFKIGESINSSIFNLMESINLDEILKLPDMHCRSSGNVSTWGSIDGHLAETNTMNNRYGYVMHIDRNRFESEMLSRMQKFVQDSRPNCKVVLESSVESLSRNAADKWSVKVSSAAASSKGLTEITPDWILDCTGINATFRSQLSAAFQANNILIDNMVALSRTYSMPPGELEDRYNHTILTECTPFGWYYSSILPTKEIIVSLFCDGGWLAKNSNNYKLEHWNKLLADNAPHTWKRVVQGKASNDYNMCTARSHIMQPAAGEGWICAGDAASSFDPVASCGIGNAISSGIAAGRVVEYAIDRSKDAASKALRQYDIDTQRNFFNYLQMRKRTYMSERRFPDSEFWNAVREFPIPL